MVNVYSRTYEYLSQHLITNKKLIISDYEIYTLVI